MSEFKRDMDEIWTEIEKATEDIDVPDSLLPDNIVKELKQKVMSSFLQLLQQPKLLQK